MTHTQTQGADGAGTKTVTLWCMHISGPDDVHAAPDFWTALAWASELNAAVAARAIKQGWAGDDNWPLAQATVQRWPWSSERHADSLAIELAVRASQKAALASPRADSVERTGVDVDRAIAAALAGIDIKEEAEEYEFCTDSPGYTPTGFQKVLLIDFAHGLMNLVHEAVRPLVATAPTPATPPGVPDSLREIVEEAVRDIELLDAANSTFVEAIRARGEILEPSRNLETQRAITGGACIGAVRSLHALIAAQPAGQAGDAGAFRTGLPEANASFKAAIKQYDAAMDQAGGRDGAALEGMLDLLCRFYGYEGNYRRREVWQVVRDLVAPNSTRTGAAETEVVRIFKDGDAWCCLLGENLQDGISGFGDTPDGALKAFHRKLSGDLVPALRAALKTADETLRGVIHDHTTLDWLLDQEEEGHGPLATIKAALAARPEAPSDAGGLATVIAAKAAEIGPIFLDTGKQRERYRTYIASKTAHAPRWRQLRADGLPIISTWIDEAGKGETGCFTDLWQRCVDEAASADAVIVYREPGEVLKGAFVEVGAALAVGTPVYAVGCDEFSFVHHAGVTRCADFGQALALALPTPPSDPDPSGQAEG